MISAASGADNHVSVDTNSTFSAAQIRVHTIAQNPFAMNEDGADKLSSAPPPFSNFLDPPLDDDDFV